jgi:alkylation response protein AidB-like acyl-CoA dehydrogenase
MDFTLSAEHEEFRSQLRRFFEAEAPFSKVAEWDRGEFFPTDVYAKMADLGLCGLGTGTRKLRR